MNTSFLRRLLYMTATELRELAASFDVGSDEYDILLDASDGIAEAIDLLAWLAVE